MISRETMTWAGPLPEDHADPAADELAIATFAGPFEAEWAAPVAMDTASETLMWAGPLPPASFERTRRAVSSGPPSPWRPASAAH